VIKKEPSDREKLEAIIEKVLAMKPTGFEEFIKLLEAENCEFKRDRRSVRLPGKKGFLRLKSLSDDYKEDAIRERIAGKRTVIPKKISVPATAPKINLLIDVQNSIKAQNSPGYERWAKVFNLKQAAKTLIFLQENDISELEKLDEQAQAAKDKYNGMQTRIQEINTRLSEITTLQKHIGAYSKTKDVYAEYKKRKFSKKFYAEHEAEIERCKAAKAFFDESNLSKLPTMNMLKQEFSKLTAEKKTIYAGHSTAKKFMGEILLARQNVQMLLNYRDTEQGREGDRRER